MTASAPIRAATRRPRSGSSPPRDLWRDWLAQGSFPDHPWRNHLQRSALVLKGLTYTPTGAILAAATTSLPETPGGERNWDYRFSWIRDSTFALWSLHSLGFDQEARDFMRFVRERAMESDGDLQIMYGIGGEHDLTEQTLDHLSGYGGAKPVRIGNGAYDQRQNDVWGALLDSIYVHRMALRTRSDQRRDKRAGQAAWSSMRSTPGRSRTRGSGKPAASRSTTSHRS